MDIVYLYSLAISVAAATITSATPLILAALAGLYAERSGVVDIGLEGKMLAGAFAAAAVATVAYPSMGPLAPWAGLAMAIAVSFGFSMLHGFACITTKGNQVVSGVAINIVVAGLAPTLAFAWFGLGGRTPNLAPEATFLGLDLPFADAIGDVPVIGPIYERLLSGHNAIVYFAALMVPITWWVLYRSRFGLRLRAVGENPAAVDTAGVSVTWLRYRALMITGMLTGVAGAYLAIGFNNAFIRDMTAGRGFLALAAVIFGKWKPIPTLIACLLFAFAQALGNILQGVTIGDVRVPVQFINALPYALTVLLLAGFVGKAIAPKASGVPYNKER